MEIKYFVFYLILPKNNDELMIAISVGLSDSNFLPDTLSS